MFQKKPPETVAVFRGDNIYFIEASEQNVHCRVLTYPSFYLIKENKRLDQDLFVCRVKSVVATIIILSQHDIKIIVGHAKPNTYDEY